MQGLINYIKFKFEFQVSESTGNCFRCSDFCFIYAVKYFMLCYNKTMDFLKERFSCCSRQYSLSGLDC